MSWIEIEKLLGLFLKSEMDVDALRHELDELFKQNRAHELPDEESTKAFKEFYRNLDLAANQSPEFSSIPMLKRFQQKRAIANGEIAFGPHEMHQQAQLLLAVIKKKIL